MGRSRNRNGRHSRGEHLTASLIAAFVVTVAMLLVIQGYYHSSRALTRTANRSRALMILESQAEVLRAAGHAALPAPGHHAFPHETLRGLPGATGSLVVTDGPVRGMSTVSLRVDWPEENGPPGHSEIVFAMSQRGMDP